MKMALQKSLRKRCALMLLLGCALASHIDLQAAHRPFSSSLSLASEANQQTQSVSDELEKGWKENDYTFKVAYTKEDQEKFNKSKDSQFDVKMKKTEINLFKLYNEAAAQTEAGLPKGELKKRQAQQEEIADKIRNECESVYETATKDDENADKIDEVLINDLQEAIGNDTCATKTQMSLKYKKTGCANCDWTAVDESLLTGTYAEIAEALINGLSEQGQEAYVEYQKKQKTIARQQACKEDKKGKSLMGALRSEKRIKCLWNKKVLSQNKMSDKIDAYNEHVHARLEALVHSIDPAMRSQANNLIRSFYSRAKGFSNDSLAAKLDAMALQQQSMTGLLNLATRCGVPQMGHTVGVHGFQITACLMPGVRRIQLDMRHKSHNMARHYRSVTRQSAQALSTYMHQRFGDEFNELLQHPVRFVSERRRGLYSQLGAPAGMSADMSRSTSGSLPINSRPINSHTQGSQGIVWPSRMPSVTRGHTRSHAVRSSIPAPRQQSLPRRSTRRPVFRRN